MDKLESYRVRQGLDLFYIPALLSSADEARLMSKVQASKTWHTLSHRRLQALPSQLLAGTTLLKQALPAYLQEIVDRFLLPLGVFDSSPHKAPNHVLVNEYLPGQGILPHEDGPAYYPLVCTLSLESHCVYHLLDKETRAKQLILVQEPGSLLVTAGETYSRYLHGIDSVELDQDLSAETIANWDRLANAYKQPSLQRDTRISLTFRDVLKEKALVSFGRR